MMDLPLAPFEPRSFLLTVHEPSSAVLEDLRTGQRVHVAELADLGSRVAGWLPAGPDGEPPSGEIAANRT
jgi:hypothetical protein